VLGETDPQATIWELLLPEEVKRLPAELVRVDAYLDDERFLAPWRALFDRRLGRPSIPVDTLLRLLYLKHRSGLGYERLCREVADSISWRRLCRIGLDRPMPHPTTLVKLVRRAGPEVIEQRTARCWTSSPRTSCWGAASCGWIPPWWRPTSTTRPMPTCWRRPCASWVGSSGGSRPAVRPAAPACGIVAERLGVGSSRSPGRCGGAPGRPRRRSTGSPPRSPASPGGRSVRPSGSSATPAGRVGSSPATGSSGGCWSV
jgi:hypothetical protein